MICNPTTKNGCFPSKQSHVWSLLEIAPVVPKYPPPSPIFRLSFQSTWQWDGYEIRAWTRFFRVTFLSVLSFKWPFRGLSALHLGNQKVTWKKLEGKFPHNTCISCRTWCEKMGWEKHFVLRKFNQQLGACVRKRSITCQASLTCYIWGLIQISYLTR